MNELIGIECKCPNDHEWYAAGDYDPCLEVTRFVDDEGIYCPQCGQIDEETEEDCADALHVLHGNELQTIANMYVMEMWRGYLIFRDKRVTLKFMAMD